MNKNKFIATIGFIAMIVISSTIISCKKYLDASPNKQLTTPNVEQDLRAILDNNNFMNGGYSSYGAIASDDYYVSDENYQSVSDDDPSIDYYIWGFNGDPTDWYYDWATNYQRIFHVNVVLDNIDKVQLAGASQADLNRDKGEALFYRAYTHFQLSQIYALPYNPTTAANTLGVPLRLTSDINVPVTRPTLKDEFTSIINDLKEATTLLPDNSSNKLRPCRPAAYANVYLVMQDYMDAESVADSALTINDSLIDYNNVSATQEIPFELFNKEVIWEADIGYSPILYTSDIAVTDSILFGSYAKNDLRKYLYFDTSNRQAFFKGFYNGEYQGTSTYFAGLAVDELYLIKAESAARDGDIATAMNALNTLAKNRFDKDSFIPFNAPDKDSAVHLIMDMRRKELCFRGMSRWIDIRRFNQLTGEQITLKRNILGQTFILAPTDLHYAFLIPQTVIDISHIQQNQR